MLKQTTPSNFNVRLHNVRYTADGSGHLEAVGNPAAVASDNFTPLLSLIDTNGNRTLFLTSGLKIYSLCHNPADPTISANPLLIGTLPAPALSAIENSADEIMVFTSAGRIIYNLNSSGSWVRREPDTFPPVRIVSAAHNVASGNFPQLKLSHTVAATDSALSATDSANVQSALLQAYSALRHSVSRTGCLAHPVVARYRLLNHNGHTLFVSPLTIIAPQSGFTFPAVSLNLSASRDSVPAQTFSLPTCQLKLLIDNADTPPSTEVAELVIEATPELSPVDFSASPGNVTLTRKTDGSLSASVDFSGLSAESVSWLTPQLAISCFNRLAQVVARIPQPFTGGKSEITPKLAFSGLRALSPAKAAEKIRGILTANVPLPDPDEIIRARFAFPNSSVGSLVRRSGRFMVIANPAVVRFHGYPVEYFRAQSATPLQGSWQAYTAVAFRNGNELVVTQSSGSADAPLTLSPVLSYPSPDAVSLTVCVDSLSGCFKQTFPLVSMPECSIACFCNENLAEINLTQAGQATFNPPQSSLAICSGQASVLSVESGRNGNAVHYVQGLPNKVSSLWNVPVSGRGLEARLGRFYLFSSGGTSIATLSDKGRFLGISQIDSSPVSSPLRVCAATAQVLALSDFGTLISFAGSSPKILLEGLHASAIACNRVRNELWFFPETSSGESDITVYNLAHKAFFTRSPLNLKGAVANFQSVSAFTVENVGVVWLGDSENTSQTVDVKILNRFCLRDSSSLKPPLAFNIHANGRNLAQSLWKVKICPLCRNSATVEDSVQMSHPFDGPLSVAGPFPVATEALCAFSAKALPGTRFRAIEILY